MTTATDLRWISICPYDRLTPERGVAALIDGTQVAVFRSFDGSLFAISNIDPFSGSAVLSRGIIGSRGSLVTVASPLHKQVFDLGTGQCLDDPEVSVAVFAVRIRDGQVEVGL